MVPEGYCYSEWMESDDNGNGSPGYYYCQVDESYCADSAMAHMPECQQQAAQESPTVPESIFLSSYTNSKTGDVKIALWNKKSDRDACVTSSSSEAKPSFGLKVRNAAGDDYDFYSFNFSTKDSMGGSIDEMLDQMSNGDATNKYIAKRIIDMGETRESWRVEQCSNSPYSDETNCKFRLEEFESHTWEDWSSGSPVSVTEKYSKWWWDVNDFDNNTSNNWSETTISGLSSETVQCTFDATDGSGLPFCPPYASTSGSYTQYYKTINNEKSKLMLVCKTTQSYGSGSSYSYLQQHIAGSDVRSTAVSQMDGASGCDATYASDSGHILAGIPKIQIESIRRIAMELALSKNYKFDESTLCEAYEPANEATFFSSCDSLSHDDPGKQLCYTKYNFTNDLGMDYINSHSVFGLAGTCFEC